jgi:hypothetical protein
MTVCLCRKAPVCAAFLFAHSPVAKDDEISRCIAALREGAYVETETTVTLRDGVQWPRLESSILVKRACYQPFFDHVLEGLLPYTGSGSGPWGFIVTGQPGIGKSTYAWLILLWVLKANPKRHFIYLSRQETGTHNILLSFADGLFSAHVSQLRNIAADGRLSGGLVIADSVIPVRTRLRTVVISSPGNLQKEPPDASQPFGSSKWYLPAMSEEEVRTLHKLAFPTVDEEKMELRMQLWGPIPRLVLEFDTPKLQGDAFNRVNAASRNAIASCNSPLPSILSFL